MDDASELVLLVDEADRPIGRAGKLEAHKRGQLHRALSVIIQDSHGRFLMQLRHSGKYHSGGLWTNTCCSHPRPDEAIGDAAMRRLEEEMGLVVPLEALMTVTYRAALDNGMTEHEIVHVFGGRHDGPVRPDPGEADGYAWLEPAELQDDIRLRPERYSVWLKKYVREHWAELTRPLRAVA